MPYKDIQVGEWFTYGTHTFIKTKHPARGYLNYAMESNLSFGENYGEFCAETEVNYIAHAEIYYPFMWERNEVLGIAVNGVPCKCEETVLIKDIFGDKTLICVIATTNPDICAGYWTIFNKEISIRYTNHFEYKVCENA